MHGPNSRLQTPAEPWTSNGGKVLRKLLNHIRNVLFFRIRHPWVVRGKNVHVQWSARFWSPHRLVRLGDNVGIGPYCEISGDVIIGNDVLLAADVALLSRDAHSPYIPGTTMFSSPRGDKERIVIEDDVWIGHRAIVLSGVTVGRGSVIAAGSIVTRDVPRYSIVAAEPAKVIKQRFTPEQIALHEAQLRQMGSIRDGVQSLGATE